MKDKIYDLTLPQKSILLTEQYYSNTNINNVCGSATIENKLNFDILNKAINLVIKNNDSFRLKFIKQNNVYKQFIYEYSFADIDIIDLKSKDEIPSLEKSLAKRMFNLEDKIYEFKIFKLPNNHGGFILTIHHIAADGWSLGLICRKIMETYEALMTNTEVPFNENYSYTKYIESEKEYLNSKKFLQDKEYWIEKFSDIPTPISLPNTTKSSDEFSCIANRELFSISKNLLSKISVLCKENRISLFNFFMAVISIYLHKINNINDFCLGTPILNRSNFNEKNMVGMFISVVPLRITINEDTKFIDFVKEISSNTLNILRHQRYPYEYLLENIRETDPNIPNLYNISVSYQITKANNTSNYKYTTNWQFNGTSADDLSIQFYDLDESKELNVAYDYKKLKYSSDFIRDMHYRILEIIKQIISNSDILLKDVNAITEKETNKIINKFNDTKFKYNKNNNVIEQFYKITKKYPNKIAITCNGESITYKELNEKSNALANYLISKGVKQRQVVGIMLNRSIELSIGLLAILKAGATYLPIDPSYPEDRISYMLENSDSTLLLVHNETEDLIHFDNKINISLENLFYSKEKIDNLNTKINPEDLIYLIYTSGSTGKPKGVMLKHYNITNFLYGMKEVIDFNKDKIMLSVTTICFDIFVLEFWGALTSGMTLVLANEQEQNSSLLLNKLCIKTNANMIQTTPSRFSGFIQDKDNIGFLKNMTDILVGGEALPDGLLKKFTAITKANIFNMYGPTETAVWSTVKKINKNITIGKPIVNTTCYILDKNQKLLPPYIPGELYIGGDGVSRGYYKRDELTNEKFIKSPFKKNEMIYNTGDLAYFTNNGELIHLGRTDFQVKLRGYRIELGEIENKILNIHDISHNVVITDDENKYLICYYTSSKDISPTEITEHLLKELPNYMIPSYFHRLDKIPLTPNGKLDRKKLPKVKFNNDNKKELYSTKTEKQLSKTISEILDTDEIDINAPFMTLGLDSLDLIQVQTKLVKYNYVINTQDFFKFNTIKTLAKHIDNNIHVYKDNDAQVPYEFRHKPDQLLASMNDLTLSDEHLGNVLLTGANGFIGIHLLKELIDNTDINIYCLVRGNSISHSTERLVNRFNNYFKEDISNLINNRIFILNGNIEKDNLNLSKSNITLLKDKISTIIHTAAIVKHYGDFEEFKQVNIHGTENVADFALTIKKRLIHISSISVSGNYLVKQDNRNVEFSENNLYIGQHYSNNVYVHSKFEAEKIILEKMKSGLNAQIHRIGILAGRYSDGVFQENIADNAFYSRIKSMIALSFVADSMVDHKIEFTPVDDCVKAIVRLAKNKLADNRIYHLFNHNFVTIREILEALKRFGINIEVVSSKEFQKRLVELSGNDNSKALSGIINDLDLNDNNQMSINYNFSVNIKSSYTTKYLNVLKCNWNEVNKNYLNKIISYMKDVNFI